ncbi:putative ribosomal protein YlxQ [Sporotomaculum syntrophicum]|uniref:Ribosomal protein YlxQ n=1 Tax=Sporotomaculum syntrophicum TaxID=182264 RepID=A0A9D3AYA4_9FIRM|nr:ribosomal L7Ae/L30e/S12e/Gadd45 family protein [Sporotomaculum syntrophicum]KAF1084568.1 putative ribosomal protein YlxQ [Sporotomaculum syntrophicum]
MTDAVANLLGLCRRAGKVISGETAVQNAFMKNEIKLLILAGDASKRSQEKFMQLAKENSVPAFCYSSKNELGFLLGKAPRTVVAIIDEQLARGIAGAMERGEIDLCTL